jgi:flavin-dependent dehydrogenase
MRSQVTDFLVIGAGVAGCAAALALGEHHTVTLVDRAAAAPTRIGESMPGASTPLLLRLGLMDRFLADGHRAALGKASVWGSNELVRRDGFVDPQGPGWCLHRQRFDAMLRDAARDRGARLVAPAALAALTRRRSGEPGWHAQLHTAEDDWAIDARFVVLAHGRGTPPMAADPPLVVRPLDRLVCRYALAAASTPSTALAGFSLVEAVAEGWWYQATLPDGRRLLAYHTDADLPSARQACHPEGFAALLGATRALDIAPLPATASIGRASARSQALDRACGADWCAVGDAACAFDPLSSQGLFHALYTGVRGAEAAALALHGDDRALAAYGSRIGQIVAAYATNLATFYGLETRFGDRPFWARRRGPSRDGRSRPAARASAGIA